MYPLATARYHTLETPIHMAAVIQDVARSVHFLYDRDQKFDPN
jgi:hypothetical protein